MAGNNHYIQERKGAPIYADRQRGYSLTLANVIAPGCNLGVSDSDKLIDDQSGCRQCNLSPKMTHSYWKPRSIPIALAPNVVEAIVRVNQLPGLVRDIISNELVC